jgi:hypothetical protein
MKFSHTNTLRFVAGLGIVSTSALAAASSDISCSIGESKVWRNGFKLSDIEVVNNSDTAIDEWQVQILLDSSTATVENYWNTIITQEDDIVTAENTSYNGSLGSGESTTFGLTGRYSGEFGDPSCVVKIDGIDSATGYAENYVLTGNEMTLDFDSVSWNVVKVETADELEDALDNAAAGDKIILASGVTYAGNFELNVGGSQYQPIWIVGEDSSDMPVLDGEDYNNSTVLSIDGADSDDSEDQGISYIYIQDIKVTNGRTGISVDQGDYVTIDNVEVYDVGQAGIHIRDGSEYNIIKNSYVHDTGLYNVKYGEGIYIGSDYRKWDSNADVYEPSTSYDPGVDYTQVLNNIIGPNVTAEHIDVKEGSSYAYIISNTFDAEGMIDIINGGLSYIDFKGNYAEAAYNYGNQNDNEYFENAFEINEKWTGWGYNNDIHDNVLTFNDEYYDDDSVEVTITLALGSSGNANSESTTEDIDPDHWVVKSNVDDSSYTNIVSNNTRDPEDADKMYKGDLTEY